MDPGRRVSFEKEYSSKVAAVLEQMKETLRRAGQVDDIEVREREREREENGEREMATVLHLFVDLPSRVGNWLPLSSCGVLCSGRGARDGQGPYSHHEW